MVENNGFPRGRILLISLLLTLSAGAAFAQTTSFTYQGRLSDGGTAANGTYDLQFALFDSARGGADRRATNRSDGIGERRHLHRATRLRSRCFPGRESLSGDWRAVIRGRSVHDSLAAPADHFDTLCDPQFECFNSRLGDSKRSAGWQRQLHSEHHRAAGREQFQHQRHGHGGRNALR